MCFLRVLEYVRLKDDFNRAGQSLFPSFEFSKIRKFAIQEVKEIAVNDWLLNYEGTLIGLNSHAGNSNEREILMDDLAFGIRKFLALGEIGGNDLSKFFSSNKRNEKEVIDRYGHNFHIMCTELLSGTFDFNSLH